MDSSDILARKWVHESSLLDRVQCREDARDLPHATPGVKLGKAGARRFAPTTVRGGAFRSIEPSQFGDLWFKLDALTYVLQMHVDIDKRTRVSFVFDTQCAVVSKAYKELDRLTRDEDSDDMQED